MKTNWTSKDKKFFRDVTMNSESFLRRAILKKLGERSTSLAFAAINCEVILVFVGFF
jgi:hypothetical protein